MRRTASEILNDLEIRVARLERQASRRWPYLGETRRASGGIGFFSLLTLMQEYLDKTPSIYVGSDELETAFKDFLSSFGLHYRQSKFSELEIDREPDGLELTFMVEGRFFYVELVPTPNGGVYFKKL